MIHRYKMQNTFCAIAFLRKSTRSLRDTCIYSLVQCFLTGLCGVDVQALVVVGAAHDIEVVCTECSETMAATMESSFKKKNAF